MAEIDNQTIIEILIRRAPVVSSEFPRWLDFLFFDGINLFIKSEICGIGDLLLFINDPMAKGSKSSTQQISPIISDNYY